FRDGSFGGKLVAALSPPANGAALPHAACAHRRLPECGDMPAVDFREMLWQQHVQRPADDFFRRIAEDPLRAAVEQDDALPLIHGDDGVVSQIEDLRENVGRHRRLIGIVNYTVALSAGTRYIYGHAL